MQVSARQLLHVLLVATAGLAWAETTENVLDPNAWDVQGNVSFWNQGDNPTWVYSYTQGQVKQEIDLSAYDQVDLISYGAASWGCNNYVGGHCGSTNPNYYDKITVSLSLDGVTVDTHTVTLDYNQGFIDYDYTYAPTSDAETALLSFTSYDPGYWAGYYAAATTDTYFVIDYSTAAPEPVVVPAAADPVLATTVLAPTITAPPPVELPQVELPAIDISADSPPEPAAEPSPEPTTEPTAETPGGDNAQSNESMGGPDSGTGPGDAGGSDSTPSPGGGDTKSSGQTRLAAVMANIDLASASMESLGELSGDPASPVAQALALVVMAEQGVQLTDMKLVEPELPKGPKISDNPNLKDRFWINSLASDAKFEKYMVNAQWK